MCEGLLLISTVLAATIILAELKTAQTVNRADRYLLKTCSADIRTVLLDLPSRSDFAPSTLALRNDRMQDDFLTLHDTPELERVEEMAQAETTSHSLICRLEVNNLRGETSELPPTEFYWSHIWRAEECVC